MKIATNLFKIIILISILFTTNIKAALNNKILLSVGTEIITKYDVAAEINFLSIFSKKQFEKLTPEEIKKISIDTLIKEKIKLNGILMYPDLVIKEKQINDSLILLSKNLKLNNIENLKTFLKDEKYSFKKLIKKIELELKWNQLVYQINKNKVIINKEKIDKKLKKLILNQKQNEYLISEIFIESSNKTDLDNKSKEAIKSIELEGFKTAALKFSTSSSSSQGGSLGWVTEDEISEYLLEHIIKTEVGSTTDRIYVSNGIIIFKIEDKRTVKANIDVEKKMIELIEIERNRQLEQFSISYYNQIKNNTIIKFFNE